MIAGRAADEPQDGLERRASAMIRTRTLQAAQLATLGLLAAASGWLLPPLAARVGPAVVLVPVAVAGLVALLARPDLTLAVIVGLAVVLENDPEGFLPVTARFYGELAHHIVPMDLLLVVAVLGVLGVRGRTGEPPRGVGAFTGPLVLLALGYVQGTIVGLGNGATPNEVLDAVRTPVYFIVLPFLVVNAAGSSKATRIMVAVLAVLTVVKGVEGAAAAALGRGSQVGTGTLVYYEPTANWLLMLFLLGVLALVLVRTSTPRWALGAVPLVFAALLLSYRRSFWLATVFGAVLVGLLSSLRGGRKLTLPLFAAVSVALWLALATGGPAERQSALVQRAQSLNPTKIEANAEDRYRNDERANVLAEIGRHPLEGIGLAVPWTATHPLSVEHEHGRDYTHIVALWYWLKLGLVGLVAYGWLMTVALRSAWIVSRWHVDARLRAMGLAACAGLAGLALAELTGSFTGVDLRFSIVMTFIIGWLALAREEAEAAHLAPPMSEGAATPESPTSYATSSA